MDKPADECKNASRLSSREAFLTTWITTDARGTGGKGGSKEVKRVTEYEWKRYKTARNVRKKFSVPVWVQETGRSSRPTRTKIPLKSTISEGFFLFFVYCGAGGEIINNGI